MIATLSIFIENIYKRYNMILFYWHNETSTFVTCWSSSPNQFVPGIVSPLPCLSVLVRNILLFVYFFEEVISFIGSIDKCHTSFFKALIIGGNVFGQDNSELCPSLALLKLRIYQHNYEYAS